MKSATDAPVLKRAVPVLFVSDVEVSADFFRDKLGFVVDFLHGDPPFYGSVSRGEACLHLRFVHEPVLASDAREREEELLAAFLDVENVQALFAEYQAVGVEFAKPLGREDWGGSTFLVRDPDRNLICFAE